MVEEVKNIDAPKTFSKRSLARDTIIGLREHPESFELSTLERERLSRVHDVLTHPGLDLLIEQGKVTFGMVKPQAYESRDLVESQEQQFDDLASQRIIGEIGDNVIFQLPIVFTKENAEDFYGPIKDRYQGIKLPDGRTVWDTIMKLVTSGPATAMLIYREEGDAIPWWRNKMGKTNPTEADPQSIRGKYALPDNLPNNLVHGSDQPAEVKREISVIASIVGDLVKQSGIEAQYLPKEDTMRNVGFLSEGETLLSIEKVFEGRGAESFIYGYRVYVIDADGEVKPKFLKERHVVSMGGDLVGKARDQEKKVLNLQDIGVPVQRYYGREDATLYSEFIPHDGREGIMDKIKRAENIDQNGHYDERQGLDQLIEIAVRLDKAGYHPLDFTRDLIYDEDYQRFVYMDFGFDLGSHHNDESRSSLGTLTKKFQHHSSYITSKYQQVKSSL